MQPRVSLVVFALSLCTGGAGCTYSSALWQGADTTPCSRLHVGAAMRGVKPMGSRVIVPLATELTARYGVSERVDVGGKLSLSPGIELGPKLLLFEARAFAVAWLLHFKWYRSDDYWLDRYMDEPARYTTVVGGAAPLIASLHIGTFELVAAADLEAGNLWRGRSGSAYATDTEEPARSVGGFVALGGRLGLGFHTGSVTWRPEVGLLRFLVRPDPVAGNPDDRIGLPAHVDAGFALVFGRD